MKISKSDAILAISFIMIFAANASGQTMKIDKAKAEISELLKNKAVVMKTADKDDPKYDSTVRYSWGDEKNIFVFEDRIEFRKKKESTVINFAELRDYRIFSTSDQQNNEGVVLGDFLIMLNGNINGKKLADDFIFLQDEIGNQAMEKEYAPQLVLFEPVAANYRSLEIKPQVPEEQRKFIVQANSFNEQKNFRKAIELYLKATEVDQTSYPDAYSNLALLSAQVGNYYQAVYYMKKYLMLVPEASDARAAQDKIYVWQGMTGE